MDPFTISMGAIQAGFQFGIELLKYLQTPEGQKFAARVNENSVEWDAFWKNAGDGIKKLFEHAPKPS